MAEKKAPPVAAASPRKAGREYAEQHRGKWVVEYQAINQKTGQPWQRGRRRFFDNEAEAKEWHGQQKQHPRWK